MAHPVVHMTYEGKKLYQINPKFCLFVYFAIILSTFRLFKGQQFLNNMLRANK